jgi:KDO2-lipid IV(A) lauroyltransferase
MARAFLFLRAGISNFFQSPLSVLLAKQLHIYILRIYMYFLGFFYYSLRKNECRQIKKGIRYFQAVRDDSSRSNGFFLFYKTLSGIFEHYLEKLVMAYRPLSKLLCYFDKRLTIRSREILDDAYNLNKGAILVTGHFGAVEFLPMALFLKGYKVAMICKFKTSSLKQELASRAKERNITLIDGDQPGVALKALKAIKDGCVLITECDEFKEWRLGCEKIDVLGQKVNSDKTLEIFYKKARVPTMLGLMRRDANGRYTLCVEALADGKEKVTIAKEAWKKLEKYIHRYPEQWYQWADFSKLILDNCVNDTEDSQIPITNTVSAANYS